MTTDVLVQTRVPTATARWLVTQARENGETGAAFHRRLLVQLQNRSVTACWVEHARACDPARVLGRGSNPAFLLALQQELGGGEALFILLHPNGRPVTPEYWRTSTGDLFRTLSERRFVLEGSHLPWKVLSSRGDATKKAMLLVLAPEERKILDVRMVKRCGPGSALIEVLYSDGEKRLGKVDTQHGAIHYPTSDGTNFTRAAEGWPEVPPDLVGDAIRRGIPD
jgi:hypothetical protein